MQVTGTVTGKHVSLTIKTPSGTQHEERDLQDVPVLSVNLPRRLAALGLKPGTEQQFLIFDPATLRNEPVTIHVGKREIVNVFAQADPCASAGASSAARCGARRRRFAWT